MLKPVGGWDHESRNKKDLAFQLPIRSMYWDIAEVGMNAIFIGGAFALQVYLVAWFLSLF